jgi:hypothetical protein
MFQMFQLFFKRMLQVFYLDVAYIAVDVHVCCKCVFQIFQQFHLDVAYITMAIHVCCVPNVSPISDLSQVFYLDVVICCSGYTYMLQTYVSIVSPGSSMLQQMLLLTRSDLRARTRCMHPSSTAYLCHAGQLQ